MVYGFEFKIRTGYEFAFNALLKGIYPFNFYGISVYEIYKYTVKRVEAVEEISPPSLEDASVVVPIGNLYDTLYNTFYEALQKKEIDLLKLLNATERGTVSLDIASKATKGSEVRDYVLEILFNSLKDADNLRNVDRQNLKKADFNFRELSKNAAEYVLRDLIKESANRKLIAVSLIYSDIITHDVSNVEAINIVDRLLIKRADKNMLREYFDYTAKSVETFKLKALPLQNKYISRINRQNIKKRKYKRANTISEISRAPKRQTEPVNLIRYNRSKYISPNTQFGGKSKNISLASVSYLSDIVAGYRKFLVRNNVREILADSLVSPIDKVALESNSNKKSNVEYGRVEAYLKDLMDVLTSSYSITRDSPAYSELNNKIEVLSGKSKDVSRVSEEIIKDTQKDITPILPTYNKKLKDAHVIVRIRKDKLKSTYTVSRVRKTPRKFTKIAKETFKNKYKDLRFYKRWRYRTGTAHDKIWLNPQKEYLLKFEEKEVAVEAVISFKAMLDFILFVEQILYVNKDHFSACVPVHAIDRFVWILIEWITEARPNNDVSPEYEYLVRWCKWITDGYRSKYIDDKSLSGLVVLEKIRDEMVRYFESRWGKRIVEYGVGGMYIYSKDRSYIDRIRGRKHGDNRRTWGGDMKREYGISENELIWDVEEERKRDSDG